MMSVKGVNVADLAGWELGQRGYRVGYAVLNAVWYGVPQLRERMFVIGIRRDVGGEPEVPVPTHVATLPSGYSAARVPDDTLAFVDHYELAIPKPVRRPRRHDRGEALDDLPR